MGDFPVQTFYNTIIKTKFVQDKRKDNSATDLCGYVKLGI